MLADVGQTLPTFCQIWSTLADAGHAFTDLGHHHVTNISQVGPELAKFSSKLANICRISTNFGQDWLNLGRASMLVVRFRVKGLEEDSSGWRPPLWMSSTGPRLT